MKEPQIKNTPDQQCVFNWWIKQIQDRQTKARPSVTTTVI